MPAYLKGSFTVLVIALSLFARAQNQHHDKPDPYDPITLKIDLLDTSNHCQAIDSIYKQDENNHIVRLFLQGGIAPVRYTGDADLEKKNTAFFSMTLAAPHLMTTV